MLSDGKAMAQDGKACKFRKGTSEPNGKGTCLKEPGKGRRKGEEKNGRNEKNKAMD